MHRLNVAILALWLAFAPAFAQVGGLSFPGPGPRVASGGGGFSLTEKGNSGTGTTGTSINYGTLTPGAGCNAAIFVVYWYNTATTDTITSLTYGGTSASAVAGTATNSAANGGQSVAMLQFNSPGTSGAVVVNYSAATTFNSNVTVYCLVTTTTAVNNVNVAGFSCNNATPISATITVPSGGGAIAASSMASGSVITWTNATSDTGSPYTGGGTQDAWAKVTGTGLVTSTPTTADQCTLSLAAWGP